MEAPQDKAVSPISRPCNFFSRHRPFIVVWLALFISVAGIGMVSPLLPVFAEDMGASGIWLGLAFSSFALTQVPLMPVVGKLSDKLGKKLFLWAGLLIYTAAAIGYFWSPGYHELVLFRMLSGVGAAMVIPIAFAYVGDLAPRGFEARYMALFNMAMIAGFGIGPVLGGAVYDGLGMDAAFGSMAILSLAGAVVVIAFLPGTKSSPRTTTARSGEKEKPASSYGAMLMDKGVRGVISFQLTYGLLFGTILSFIGIWMTDEIGTTVSQVGIVLAARVLVNGALVYPFGILGDKVNRTLLSTAGMVLVVAGTFSIPWMESFALLLGLFVVMGVSESMGLPSINAIAVERGRVMGMGSVMGISNMAMSLGLVAGSLSGGLIEDSLGIISVFRGAALIGLAGTLAFTVFMLRSAKMVQKTAIGIQPVTDEKSGR